MDPLTIGLIACAIGGIFGGTAGYAFGSSEKEAKFKLLQDQIAKQAKIIAEQEAIIETLIIEIQLLKTNRSVFQQFMWYVFKSDPALFKKFSQLENQEKEKLKIMTELKNNIAEIKKEFPEHPVSKVMF